MWQLVFLVFLISLCIFAGIMVFEPRTLWSGVSFFWTMSWLALLLFLVLSEHTQWLASHTILIGLLAFLFVLSIVCVLAFPAVLILVFFIEGIRMVSHEGMKPSNLLSMAFSMLLYIYLAVWPAFGYAGKSTFGAVLYGCISCSAVYVLVLMAMYTISAILNLIHLKKKRNADYIVVLGCGIMGEQVTPLLAARIDRGIELLRYNPGAMLILSGGQGPGENIPESEAMALYAMDKGVDQERIIKEEESVSTEENLLFSRNQMDKECPSIIVVTTAYHVFRALILARRQGIKCVGFGAKTKWYFTLNALIREFVGYLRMTWKKHAVIVGSILVIIITLQLLVS